MTYFFINQGISRRYAVALIVSLFLGTLGISAQTLKGTILDARTHEPIIGAVVSVKTGKTLSGGTSTDINGNFTLAVKSVPATIVASYTGYNNEEINIYEITEDEIQIELTENFNALQGVVVVGYGTQKKSDLAGAVSSVKLDDVKGTNAASLDGLLNGKSAGVQVTPTSGQPGGGMSIRVRGGSSVQGGNEPLYVIDGFPVYNSSATAGVLSGSVTNPLASINPGDIESINILKDASATAIYGSRGANGVVIITTKQGKAGERAKITYEGSVGVQSLRKKIDVLDAQNFARLRNESLYDQNPSKGRNQYLSDSEINALGHGTDWQDEAFRSALVQNHNLSVSGGTEKTHYAVSVNWLNQDGIIINTDFSRISGRLNLDSQLSKVLKLGINATVGKNSANVAPSGVVGALLLMPPTATVYEDDGSYTLRNPFENIFSNPISTLNQTTNKTRNYKFLGTGYADFTLLQGLNLKIQFGADVDAGKEYSYVPSTTYEGSSVQGNASLGSVTKESWLNENTLTYTKDWNDRHHLDALVGFTQQTTRVETQASGSSGFVTDLTKYNNLASGSVISTPKSSASENSLISYLARVNYNYLHRYFVTASIRRDGSSRFGKDNKWGTFPSLGLSWQANEEEFLKPLTKTFSSLKVRASYGKTGNQEIGNYQSLSTLSSTKYMFGGVNVIGFTPDRITNNDLGWETTHQFDFGVDLSLFNNRLDFTIDAYVKKTTDLLLSVEIPYTTGYDTSLQNYGSVRNVGVEFSVTSHNFVKKNFSWDTDFNISFNRNKVLSLGNGSDYYIYGSSNTGSYIAKVGEPLGSFYGLVTDGILQTGEEKEKAKFTSAPASAKAGDQLYKDIDGDEAFSTTNDRTIVGNAQPDFTFGIANNIRYKNWDISFFFQGVVGNEIINANELSLSLYSGQQNATARALGRWTESNPSTTVNRAKLDPATNFSDIYVEDGSFLRLKTATLAYNFKKSVLRSLHLSSLKLYVTGNNLWTLTNYSGFDPEITTASNIYQGRDSGAYPVAKSYSFGIVVGF
jgi:TonB-linked SusC/RagA family outer membrane protein